MAVSVKYLSRLAVRSGTEVQHLLHRPNECPRAFDTYETGDYSVGIFLVALMALTVRSSSSRD